MLGEKKKHIKKHMYVQLPLSTASKHSDDFEIKCRLQGLASLSLKSTCLLFKDALAYYCVVLRDIDTSFLLLDILYLGFFFLAF